MSQGITDLNASIATLAGQDTTLDNALVAVSSDILSVVTSMQSQLAAVAGSAPTVDLSTQIASLTKIGTDLGVLAGNLGSLQATVDAAGKPVVAIPASPTAIVNPPSTATTASTSSSSASH